MPSITVDGRTASLIEGSLDLLEAKEEGTESPFEGKTRAIPEWNGDGTEVTTIKQAAVAMCLPEDVAAIHVLEAKDASDALREDAEQKVIRRVRTPAGKKRFGQPIGSIIVRDGAKPLTHLRAVDDVYDNGITVQGTNGKTYHLTKDEDAPKGSQWVALGDDLWDDVVVDGFGSQEDALEALNVHVRGSVRVTKNRNRPPNMSKLDRDKFDRFSEAQKEKYFTLRDEGQTHAVAMNNAENVRKPAKKTTSSPKGGDKPKGYSRLPASGKRHYDRLIGYGISPDVAMTRANQTDEEYRKAQTSARNAWKRLAMDRGLSGHRGSGTYKDDTPELIDKKKKFIRDLIEKQGFTPSEAQDVTGYSYSAFARYWNKDGNSNRKPIASDFSVGDTVFDSAGRRGVIDNIDSDGNVRVRSRNMGGRTVQRTYKPADTLTSAAPKKKNVPQMPKDLMKIVEEQHLFADDLALVNVMKEAGTWANLTDDEKRRIDRAISFHNKPKVGRRGTEYGRDAADALSKVKRWAQGDWAGDGRGKGEAPVSGASEEPGEYEKFGTLGGHHTTVGLLKDGRWFTRTHTGRVSSRGTLYHHIKHFDSHEAALRHARSLHGESEAPTVRIGDQDLTISDRVETEYGPGKIISIGRGIGIELDSGENINVVKGTPGHSRLKPFAKKPESFTSTAAGLNEAQFAKETAEGSDRDPGFRIEGRQIVVYDVDKAVYSLDLIREIHADNAEDGWDAGSKRSSRAKEKALAKLIESIKGK